MSKLIGIIGETGAGKDVICNFVKQKYQKVLILRFSDPLWEALSVFLDEKRKEDLQWMFITLAERFGEGILWNALKKRIQRIKNGIVVLSGIRRWPEFYGIKKMGGEILYVTAPSKLRWQRIHHRGEKKDDKVSYKKFLQIEKAKTELLIPSMGKKADFTIENSGTKEEFYKQIKEALRRI